MNENDFEYFEGTKTILHDDGSTTYVTTYHEPYVEPLTPKQSAALIGASVAVLVGIVALPFGLDRLYDWADHRKEVRRLKHQKKIDDILSTDND